MNLRIMLAVIFLITTSLAQEKEFELLKADEDEIKRAESLGEVVAEKLTGKLKSELMFAIKNGGPVNAVNVCRNTAPELTSELTGFDESIVEVKRTTRKYRNQANAPSELEELALDYFEKAGKNAAEFMVQKYSKNGVNFIDYYKPLRIGGLCKTCHGKTEEINPELLEVIRKNYPDDKATGYETGDFRGVIKVTLTNK
ncbi:MAG: DUF3365 domain-containing protein [Melioribacteraceae bacterium]|nr:DUF3365 domain-containing protein [Melioribacteraceae bacterium]